MTDQTRPLSPFLLGTTTSLTGGVVPSSPYAFPSKGLSAPVGESVDGTDEPELEPTGPIRMISATVGALITSFVVTPFDVIKTRLQAQLHLLHPHHPQSTPYSHPHTPGPSSSSSSSSSSFSSHSHSHHPLQPPLQSHPQAQSSSFRPLAVSVARLPHLSTSAMLDRCSHTRLQTGLMDTWCDRCVIQAPRLSSASMGHSATASLTLAHASNASMHFTGTFDALTKLVRYEGVGSLWRGLSPQLLLSIPSTVVYFWAYDELKHSLQSLTSSPHPPGLLTSLNPHLALLTPLLAGTSARALTTVLVSPIELIRTRTQSLSAPASMVELARAEVRKGGWRSLWRGANPTLWRDVPFSAFYWTSYEWIKGRMMQSTKLRVEAERQRGVDSGVLYERSLLWTSFVAGASSGLIAAFFTHPFDLIKTRRQIEMYNLAPLDGAEQHSSGAHSVEGQKGRTATFELLRTIVREEGWVGLSTGMFARMTKIVPACAIMISTYEISKSRFGKAHHSRTQERAAREERLL